MKRKLLRCSVPLFALLIGCFATWRTLLAHRVDSKLRTLREAAVPASGAELDKWYVPAGIAENSAIVVTQAFDLMRNYQDSRSNDIAHFKVASRSQVLTREESELLAVYVALNQAALAKLAPDASSKNCRYPIDLSLGVYAPAPHLGKIKALARALQFEVLVRSTANDASETGLSIERMIFLARTLENEPLLISQLTRMAVLDIAAQTLEWTLNKGSLEPGELVRLSTAFQDAERTNGIARALIGERAIDIPYFRMSSAEALRITHSDEGENGPPQPMLPGKPAVLLRVTGFFERDLDFFLGVMETNIALAQLPYPQSLRSQAAFQEASSTAQHRYYMLSSMLLPAFEKAVVREAESLARLRCARAALAIEQFRRSRGHLPENLMDLPPESTGTVLLDPFDGNALRYRISPRGYVIYSVDRDGHDDGGRERPVRRRSADKTPYDITFTVER